MSSQSDSGSDTSSVLSAASSTRHEQPPPPPPPMLPHDRVAPCGACRVLRRRCELTCPFAPYFPWEAMERFQMVHQVFGASKVAKFLGQVDPLARDEVARSLVGEAMCRIYNPISGCYAIISALRNELRSAQAQRDAAQAELSMYRFWMSRQFGGLDIQQQPGNNAPEPAMPGNPNAAMNAEVHPANANAAANDEELEDPPENNADVENQNDAN